MSIQVTDRDSRGQLRSLRSLTDGGKHRDGVVEGPGELPLVTSLEGHRLGHHRLHDAVVDVGDVVLAADHRAHVCQQRHGAQWSVTENTLTADRRTQGRNNGSGQDNEGVETDLRPVEYFQR